MAIVAFGAEWTTATGKSEAAIRDTGNVFGGWQAYNGTLGNNAAEIIANDGSLGGRGNFFRVFNDGTNNMTVREDAAVPPTTTHWGRVYFRNAKTVGSHNHPIAVGGISSPTASNIVAVPLVVVGQTTSTLVQVQTLRDTSGTLNGYRRTRWTPGVVGVSGQSTLNRNQWYLTEWQYQWLSATRYQAFHWFHAVDSNGNITTENMFTTATLLWEDYFGTANSDLAFIQSSESTRFGFVAGDLTGQYVFGNEGPGGGSTNGEHFDMASFALSTEGRLRDQSLTGGGVARRRGSAGASLSAMGRA